MVGVRDCHGPGGIRERAHEPRRKALPLVIMLKGNHFLDNLLCVVSGSAELVISERGARGCANKEKLFEKSLRSPPPTRGEAEACHAEVRSSRSDCTDSLPSA